MSQEIDDVVEAYEAFYAAVPEEARLFAAETWGETWSHAEMRHLVRFAEILSRPKPDDA